jgi:hypothetical protein
VVVGACGAVLETGAALALTISGFGSHYRTATVTTALFQGLARRRRMDPGMSFG